jgi:hypothetical protein
VGDRRGLCLDAKSSLERVRYAPEESKYDGLAAAFAARDRVAGNENRLAWLTAPAVVSNLVNASLWYSRSGRALTSAITPDAFTEFAAACLVDLWPAIISDLRKEQPWTV